MGRKKRRNDSINISSLEKFGVFLALLSVAERIIVMLLFEG